MGGMGYLVARAGQSATVETFPGKVGVQLRPQIWQVPSSWGSGKESSPLRAPPKTRWSRVRAGSRHSAIQHHHTPPSLHPWEPPGNPAGPWMVGKESRARRF